MVVKPLYTAATILRAAGLEVKVHRDSLRVTENRARFVGINRDGSVEWSGYWDTPGQQRPVPSQVKLARHVCQELDLTLPEWALHDS